MGCVLAASHPARPARRAVVVPEKRYAFGVDLFLLRSVFLCTPIARDVPSWPIRPVLHLAIPPRRSLGRSSRLPAERIAETHYQPKPDGV